VSGAFAIGAIDPLGDPAPRIVDACSNAARAMTGAASTSRNVTTSYALRALRGASVLVLTPYLFRELGVAGFGTWSLLFTVATIFSLVELAAALGVTKQVAELAGTGRTIQLRELVGAAAAVMLGLGVLALGLSVVLGLAAQGLASPGEHATFATGAVIIGAAQVVRLPGQAYGATLMGLQRYDLYNVGEALTVLAFVIGAVVALELGGGIDALAVAYAVSLLGGAGTWVLLLGRVRPDALAPPSRRASTARRSVFAYGWRTLLIDSMDFIAQRMDTLVVAAIRGAAAAAPLAAATRLISGVQSLVLPFTNVLLPIVAELHVQRRREELIRGFVLSTRVALQVTLLAAGGLAIFAGDVVRTWLGPTAPAVTDDIVVVLMLVQILILPAVPSGRVLLGIGRLRAITVLAIVEGLGNIGLSIVLVSQWGVIGAAVATLAVSGVLVPLRIPLACRAVGCPGTRMLRQGIGVPVLACLPSLAVMTAIRLLLEPGLLRLALGLVLGWGLGVAVALVQLGPKRLLGLVRGGERARTIADTPG
jgi:O-antigen/teichoic acid export membrane protein